ncbi:MAG: hypothetical protein ACI841_005481 [Planctomycetota bacterium]|jgi:hypothetical protein
MTAPERVHAACAQTTRTRMAAFTLAELIVAVGMASLLMAAVVGLLDSAMKLWSKGEVKRNLVEQSSGTGEMLAHDFRMLHPGAQGDLLAEWIAFDVNGDGSRDRFWPRVRMVRQASPAEIANLEASPADLLSPLDLAMQAAGGKAAQDSAQRLSTNASTLAEEHPEQLTRRPVSAGLIEVVWCILPDGKDVDRRDTGVMWRGERAIEDGSDESFFTPGYFDGGGRPPGGELQIVTGGILWCGMSFATQTTLLDEGWKIGTRIQDASGSWDAWVGDRPDLDVHYWNEAGAGMPNGQDVPLMPRRIAVEFEFEGENDRKRRARTLEGFDAIASSFDVTNGDHLPEAGHYILVGSEWMKVNGFGTDHVRVKRGQRGTSAVPHKLGEMIHHGVPVTTEVPIRTHVGVWKY